MQPYLWHLTEPLAQAVLPLFKPPIPGRQTGARIRPPPLPPRVHSPHPPRTRDHKQKSRLYFGNLGAGCIKWSANIPQSYLQIHLFYLLARLVQ